MLSHGFVRKTSPASCDVMIQPRKTCFSTEILTFKNCKQIALENSIAENKFLNVNIKSLNYVNETGHLFRNSLLFFISNLKRKYKFQIYIYIYIFIGSLLTPITSLLLMWRPTF